MKSSTKKTAKKKPKNLDLNADVGRSATLFARVKPANHIYVTKLAKEQGVSLSEYMDKIIEKHRLAG